MAELRVVEPEPANASVVERIEAVLEMARKGEFSSVAIATVYRDGHSGSSWSEVPSLSLLIGAVARMQAKLLKQADGE
jgi:hypothetical protein